MGSGVLTVEWRYGPTVVIPLDTGYHGH